MTIAAGTATTEAITLTVLNNAITEVLSRKDLP